MTERAMVTIKVRVLTERGLTEWRSYRVPLDGEMSVLNALEYVHAQLDPLVYFLTSCRRGVCGACVMRINGRRRLACQVRLEDGQEIDPLGEEDGD